MTIDFDNVDIRVFIKFVSELTGRNFLLDEKVKGKVTVISPRKIAVDEVYKVFESILEIYGFTTVDAGEVIKVVPALEARGKNMELRLNREAMSPEDKIVTQILSLQHASPDEMKKILDPLISKTSIILSYPPTGMLIITDVLSNIKRLQEIVTALDVEGVGEEISYIPLQAASATEIVKALTAVFAPQRAGSAPIRLVADEPDELRYPAGVAAGDGSREEAHFAHGQGDSAERERSAGLSSPERQRRGSGQGPDEHSQGREGPEGQAGDGRRVLSKDVNVVADKATNTLIITANRDDYRIIEEVIRKLDVPRPMVYIEALIMEVSVNKNFNIGVEWRGS